MKTIGVASVVLTLIILCASVINLRGPQATTSTSMDRTTVSVNPLANNQKEYSQEEAMLFWEKHFGERFFEEMPPEIDQRYKEHLHSIAKRYNQNLKVELSCTYLKNKNIPCACRVANGTPYAIIIVPAFMNLHKKLINESGAEEVMRTTLLIGVMHELEHLAHDSMAQNANIEEFIADEKRAWALTCQHTIAPLVEKYRKALYKSDFYYYDSWLKANRDPDSMAWNTSISRIYVPIFSTIKK